MKKSSFTCLKSTMEKPEQCVKSFQSYPSNIRTASESAVKHQNSVRVSFLIKVKASSDSDIVLMSLLLTLNRFDILSWCFHCWFWINDSGDGIMVRTTGSTKGWWVSRLLSGTWSLDIKIKSVWWLPIFLIGNESNSEIPLVNQKKWPNQS